MKDECRVCHEGADPLFAQPVLGREVIYYRCGRCGYLQTQRPTWLDEAYASPINALDTGIMMRNKINAGRVVMALWAIGRLHGRVVDHAGGYGILVRLLRDAGVEAYWRDKYCENLVARGFEAPRGHADLLTAFEVMEHFVNPLDELREMLADACVVMFSTELVPPASTDLKTWWYLGPEHGQHVGFFSLTTLQWMAQATSTHWCSDGASVHFFSRDPLPRALGSAVRAYRIAPLVTRLSLTSRLQSDYELLRQRVGGATK